MKKKKLDIKYRNSFNKSVITKLHNVEVIYIYRQNIIDEICICNNQIDYINQKLESYFKIQEFLIDVFYLLFF